MPRAKATAPTLPLTPPADTTSTIVPAQSPAIEVQAVTLSIQRYAPLKAQIETAKEAAKLAVFDYSTPAGNQAARSYLAPLRSLRVAVEKARLADGAWYRDLLKDSNARGYALEAEVIALIEPHDTKLKEIKAAEAARVDGHRERLASISQLVLGDQLSADEIRSRQSTLNTFDPTTFEEFAASAALEIVNTGRVLDQMLANEIQRVLLQAEQARLAAEAAEAQRQEEIRQVAAALAAQQLAQQQRDAAAALEAERQATAAAEARATAAERAAAAPPAPAPQPAPAPVAVIASPAPMIRGMVPTSRELMEQQLFAAITGKTRSQLVAVLLDGTFHPAVFIDWSKV